MASRQRRVPLDVFSRRRECGMAEFSNIRHRPGGSGRRAWFGEEVSLWRIVPVALCSVHHAITPTTERTARDLVRAVTRKKARQYSEGHRPTSRSPSPQPHDYAHARSPTLPPVEDSVAYLRECFSTFPVSFLRRFGLETSPRSNERSGRRPGEQSRTGARARDCLPF